MKNLSWLTPSRLVGFALILLVSACSENDVTGPGSDASAAGKKTKYDAPALACGASSQVSIDLVVTAGNSGAPSGFSIQWITKAAFEANGSVWLLSEDAALCKASFSGNANLSRYNLGPNQSVTVTIGEFLFDNGASTNCDGALICSTDYIFRAFAHGDNKLNRSDFTANRICSTAECGHDETCTLTQGYWKTHGPVPVGNNSNEWAVTSLTLGSVSYTDLELLSIFNTPAGGNGLLALAHQLIAAKLNVAAGSDDTAVAASIAAADALIGNLEIQPVVVVN
jgi:hypothetical protein